MESLRECKFFRHSKSIKLKSITFKRPGAAVTTPSEPIQWCATDGTIFNVGFSLGKSLPNITLSISWLPPELNEISYSSSSKTSITLKQNLSTSN